MRAFTDAPSTGPARVVTIEILSIKRVDIVFPDHSRTSFFPSLAKEGNRDVRL